MNITEMKKVEDLVVKYLLGCRNTLQHYFLAKKLQLNQFYLKMMLQAHRKGDLIAK